jgi:thiamine phosphate synthase YjbQ (UPF0047 family)
MRTHTTYRTVNTAARQAIIDITDDVEACRAAVRIEDGFVLVSAMHISASVFVNDRPRVFYSEWDGQRARRVVVKAMGA